MLPIPYNAGICAIHTTHQSCCGKIICIGCIHASNEEVKKGNMKKWCPFCRLPTPNSSKEHLKRLKKRIKLDDAEALFRLGNGYGYGLWGLRVDRDKAFELWSKAAELGSIEAHDKIAKAYKNGFVEGVELGSMAFNKAHHHCQLAAVAGHEMARHNLGQTEKRMGSMKRAMKHFMLSASAGLDMALKEVGEGYKAGHVSKDDYTKTLRAHQTTREEMKSEQRTKTAALSPEQVQLV